MGREALTAALCWFLTGGALAVKSLVDNVSAQSEPRLYRDMRGYGVYASGAPYGAYSFNVPLVASPKQTPAAARIIPVKENYAFQNMNAYLKDSYGNRFVESPQSPQSLQAVPFKPFPQQYVQLQELPAHFAQPLAAPSFPFKQGAPQIIVGSHYRLPLQATPAPIKQFNFPQGFQGVYAGNVKSLAPGSVTHSQFQGPLIQLPGQYQFTSPVSQAGEPLKQSYNFVNPTTQSHQRFSGYDSHQQPTAQHQSSTNEAIYANTQSEEHYHQSNDEPKFKRLQGPRDVSSEEESSAPPPSVVSDKAEEQKAPLVPVRETTITSFMNGKKTRVNLKTKPPVPLLDISLLEPLTFDNPLVPQVQHFLPRINEATYHKLPELTRNGGKSHQKPNAVHKSKTYDSAVDKVKPKKYIPKKKQKYPVVEVRNSYYDEIPSASTLRPVITIKGTPNESPEFSYEINSPNYKETYKEQAINYNKETHSEPVHITYGTQKHEEPVHYTYVHSSKEPVHIKEVRYEGNGETPKHLVYNLSPADQNNENKKHKDVPEDSNESSEQSEESPHNHHSEQQNNNEEHQNQHHDQQHHQDQNHKKNYDNHNQHHEHYNQRHEQQNHHHDSPKPSHQKPEHREQEYHHTPNTGSNQKSQNDGHHSYKFAPVQYYTKTSSGSFQPVAQFEEEIRIAAPIKVNPNQHVQQGQPEHRHQNPSPPSQQNHPSPKLQHNLPPHHGSAPHRNSVPHHSSASDHNHAPHQNTAIHQKQYAPTAHVHEKTKKILIHEETPVYDHSSGDHPSKGMFDKVEDNEKDFEQAYKNAAFGFPAYEKATDVEKDIYTPESYGVPRDHSYFDMKHSPFEQYHEQTDNFPKSSRLSYKDDMDKTKEDYFLDYSVSKPESLTDRYKNKVNYYKLYKSQKPEKYTFHDEDKKQKNEKYTAIPYSYYPTQDQSLMKQILAQYKTSPFVQEYDYSKGVPRDNSAHSTQPYHRYKSNTFFVEPQFQYGFEPLAIPKLLDSELATMASNHSPESEKPGTRKKIYKENFYVKKTSLSDSGLS